jgi:DNA gyrase/topoisomerase IV subunit A
VFMSTQLPHFDLFFFSVTNLVNLANEKADASANAKKNAESDNDQQQQINRSSLPDIPLSKKEKTELENSMLIQNCHSSESILHDRKFYLTILQRKLTQI